MERLKKQRMGLFILAICCLFLGGCFNKEVKQKEYSSHGFHIKMDEGMIEQDIATSTATFTNTETVVTALKEEFTLLESIGINKDSKIEDYAKAVIENNKENYELKEKDNIHYFEYEKTVSGKNFYYLSAVYKSSDAFWLVSFACEKNNRSTYEKTFLEWAKTVTFSE